MARTHTPIRTPASTHSTSVPTSIWIDSSFENGECNSWAKLFTEDGKVYLPATGHDPPRILHGRTELQQYCQATIDKYYQLQTIVMHHHPVLYQDLQSAIHYQFIVREDKDSSSTNLPVVAFLHFETYGLITESRIFCTRAP